MMPVFWKSMRDNRRGWIGWTVALAAIAAMYASFYPSINNPAMADALNSFPQSVKEAFHMEDYTKPENYFAVSATVHPIHARRFSRIAFQKTRITPPPAGSR